MTFVMAIACTAITTQSPADTAERDDHRTTPRSPTDSQTDSPTTATEPTNPTTDTSATDTESSEPSTTTQEDRGFIADAFLQDKGIASHPDVVFYEGYEDSNWQEKWGEVSEPGCHEAETNPSIVHNGTQSDRLVFRTDGKCGGQSGAGWLTYWWDATGSTGYDELYVRYYYRLGAGGDWSNNKILQMHGHELGERWGDGAGVVPDGTTFSVGTGVGGDQNPWDVGILYTYHMHQAGPWGDNFEPNQGHEPEVYEEQWYCKEFMVKLNDVGSRNGVQRMWLDDELVVETTGMELRIADNVKVNTLMQPSYTHAPGDRQMWLDSIVAATSRIGCVR